MWNPFKKKNNIGLDLGEHSLKIVSLEKKGRRVRLKKLVCERQENPQNSSRDILQAVVEVNELQESLCHTAIPDQDIISFTFRIPNMPEKEQPSVIRNEIEQQLTYPIEEASIDFITKKTGDNEGGEILVQAFCSRKERIHQQIQSLKKACLKPNSIEGQLLANIAALEFNGYIGPESNCIVVDLGQSHSTISLVLSGNLSLSNSLHVGSELLYRQLKEAFMVETLDAEKAVKNHLLSPQSKENSQEETPKVKTLEDTIPVIVDDEISIIDEDLDNPSPNAGQTMARVIDEFYDELGNEIKKSIDFYFESLVVQKINKVWLVGGGSNLSGIEKLFSKKFGIAAEKANPFREIELFDHEENPHIVDQLNPSLTVAVGLALRGL